MPYTHVPKYPVVDPDPSISKAIMNFNLRDCMHITGAVVGSYAYGWWQASRPLRNSNARFCGGVGLLGGLFFAIMSSTQRFMGLEPNAAEIAKFGVASQELLNNAARRGRDPNTNMIDSSVVPKK